MHPFGGSQRCPTCAQAVYAAEQVMGPGRKLYHKPCLSCLICKKRLDSFSLVEHDQEPYCKTCYAKNFSTRDLRQANLPVKESSSNPASPPRTGSSVPISPPRVPQPGYRSPSPSSSFSKAVPTSPTPKRSQSGRDVGPQEDTIVPWLGSRASPVVERPVPDRPSQQSSELSAVGIPNESKRLYTPSFSTYGKGTNTASAALNLLEQEGISGLVPKTTGTRYGAALGGKINFEKTGTPTGGSPRKWGSESPHCPKCSQRVYFAEQVKAVGQTWHKNCLRCRECNALLDSNRLRDHDGVPYCVRCYGKLHGPQGGGYALLGKAGG